MAGKDIIEMHMRELKRLKVVREAMDRQITQGVAASLAGMSERQIRRLVRAVREEGDRGIVHKSRGRPSNRRISLKVKEKVLSLYRRKYPGFGPTLASEKLQELDGIGLSDETLRQWLLEAGLWKKRRKRSSHRSWRQGFEEVRSSPEPISGQAHYIQVGKEAYGRGGARGTERADEPV